MSTVYGVGTSGVQKSRDRKRSKQNNIMWRIFLRVARWRQDHMNKTRKFVMEKDESRVSNLVHMFEKMHRHPRCYKVRIMVVWLIISMTTNFLMKMFVSWNS